MVENEIEVPTEDNRSLTEIFFENFYKKPEEEQQQQVENKPEETEIQQQEIAPVAEVHKEEEQLQEEKVVPTEKKKVWTSEYEQQVAELLAKKHGYKNLTDEQKAISFLKTQNPELDDEELSFIAASQYGIGVAEPDKDDLTDDQLIALRKQGIDRKKLLSQADSYYKDQANGIELPEPEFDTDPDYEQYKSDLAENQKKQAEQAQLYAQTVQAFETSAKNINEIKESLEIDFDDRKLPVEINFKLDEAKQKKLFDYVKNYTPSKEEVQAFTDPASGKFDYKGYMVSQAPKVFARELLASGIKQAISKDREQFVEVELKNSTLRNNDASQIVDKKFDLIDAWPFGK